MAASTPHREARITAVGALSERCARNLSPLPAALRTAPVRHGEVTIRGSEGLRSAELRRFSRAVRAGRCRASARLWQCH